MKAYERLLSYVKVFTPSSEETGTSPSTQYQFDLARLLVQELKELGVKDADVDEHCYVYGHIPATRGYESRQKLGFIAHMDTVSDFCDHPVTPVITPNYDGKDLALGTSGRILSPKMFPHLSTLKGRTLITSDGTTILGADDKAGIAEIMTMIEHLNDNTIPHGPLCIAFTPDEEIGMGPAHFNVKKFGAKFAYTMDGGEIGELEFENFNAANARIVFKGRNIHPGYAKNKMVNSIAVANEFMASLPKKEVPENTSGYEGFFHVYSIKGDVETTEIEILIRDFDRERFEWRKNTIENGVREFSKRFGLKIELELKDQYSNMREKIEPVHYIIDIAKQAMQELNIKPLIVPIRGGTDGARLSFMGLPTPNLFTGGHNFHGRYEYIPVYAMEKAVQLIIRIAELCTKI